MSDDGSSSPRLVRDLMSVGVLTCSPETSVVELTRILLEKDLEAAVVLDDHGHAVGIVSRDDLVRAYASGDDVKDLAAEAVMQDGLPQVPPDIPLTAAAQIMQDQGVRIIFLTHHAGGIEYPAAMLSYTHLLRHMAMENAADLSDLGIKANRESPLEAFIKRRDEARRQASQ
jgi:predicted transcriptional regulator